MLIVSSDMGSRPFGVILTALRAVLICGDTAAIVPWRIVPILVNKIIKLCTRQGKFVPFLSSIVTVSFAHFMRNLDCGSGSA